MKEIAFTTVTALHSTEVTVCWVGCDKTHKALFKSKKLILFSYLRFLSLLNF